MRSWIPVYGDFFAQSPISKTTSELPGINLEFSDNV
jgi:hypothetical protein